MPLHNLIPILIKKVRKKSVGMNRLRTGTWKHNFAKVSNLHEKRVGETFM